MSNTKLREIAKVPDQQLVLARMMAADHEAGRHIPALPKCPECGVTVYTEPTPKPKGAVTGAAIMKAFEPAMQHVAAAQKRRKPAVVTHPKLAKLTKAPHRAKPKNLVQPQLALVEGLAKAPPPIENIVAPIPTKAPVKHKAFTRLKAPVTQDIVEVTEDGVEHALILDLSALPPPQTREAWLLRAADAMTPWFAEVDVVLPPIRVSIGWPGGRGSKVGVRGQCWSASTVADGQPAIFITPDQHEPEVILAILLHELDHSVGNFGHRGAFAKLAGKLGLTAPWKTATPSAPLAEKLAALAVKLGPFPHSRVNPGHGLAGTGPARPPVQSTRMLKLSCPDCGYTVRTTAKWIAVGLPSCPDGDELQA